MLKKFTTYLLLLLISIFCKSQDISEKGVPFIQNYLPENYGNHGKIWEIKSAENGLVYMASENGLLEFDGQIWNRFRDYKGYTRSLHIANDSTIFIGADMDFGVWKKNKFRKFYYTSFYPYRDKIGGINEEFWGTYQIGSQIIFVSHQNLYTYQNGKIKKLPAPYRFSESFYVNGRLFLADEKYGLYEYEKYILKRVFSYPEFSLEISGIFIKNQSLFVITQNKGIFKVLDQKLVPFPTDVTSEIIKNKVFSFITIENKYWVFGTILNGLYITDFNGKIVQQINKNKGLPNNTILSLYYQKNGKLWLGLDYGISSVNIKGGITYFQNINSDFGTGYTATLKNNFFYLGTNQGLYTAYWDHLNNINNTPPFNIINGTEGQIWILQNIDGEILCGHDKGLFAVNGSQFLKIRNEPGVMCLLNYHKNYLFAGTYNGISVFKKENSTWKFLKKMSLILGAVSQIIQENEHTFWVNIPNYGLIRFLVNKNLEPEHRSIYSTKNFKGYFPYLFKDQKGIHIITSSSQYVYHPDIQHFSAEPYSAKNNKVKHLFVGFYKPQILNSDYGFYAVNNGFALEKLSFNHQNSEISSHLVFRKAEAFNNDKAFDISNGEKFGYDFNNLRIVFMLPNEEEAEYQYYLENFSTKWSKWNFKNSAEFLGLKEGHYTLWVKARKDGKFSKVQKFSFTIKAPWYRTIWIYILYFILLFAVIYFLNRLHKKRLKKQENTLLDIQKQSLRRQAEQHKQEMLLEQQKQLEQEKIKLKEEIKNKTIELATKAKDDDDKNRLLQIIGEKIIEIENNPSVSKIRHGEIRRMLKAYQETDDHTFEIQMDELHQEFFKAMKSKFPHLSIYDLRLCAYLKIGLNSKEMADILQVLPSSINVSRSRLRKKLGLQPDDDLYEFLNNVSH